MVLRARRKGRDAWAAALMTYRLRPWRLSGDRTLRARPAPLPRLLVGRERDSELTGGVPREDEQRVARGVVAAGEDEAGEHAVVVVHVGEGAARQRGDRGEQQRRSRGRQQRAAMDRSGHGSFIGSGGRPSVPARWSRCPRREASTICYASSGRPPPSSRLQQEADAPEPGPASRRISLPCSCRMRRTISRPSRRPPRPRSVSRRGGRPREQGLLERLGTPGPPSATSISTAGARAAQPHRDLAAFRVWRIVSSSRLVSTRSITPRSACTTGNRARCRPRAVALALGGELELLVDVLDQLARARTLPAGSTPPCSRRASSNSDAPARARRPCGSARSRRRGSGGALPRQGLSLSRSVSRYPCSEVSGVRRSCETLATISRRAVLRAQRRHRSAMRCVIWPKAWRSCAISSRAGPSVSGTGAAGRLHRRRPRNGAPRPSARAAGG